jgi:hypothetical protein
MICPGSQLALTTANGQRRHCQTASALWTRHPRPLILHSGNHKPGSRKEADDAIRSLGGDFLPAVRQFTVGDLCNCLWRDGASSQQDPADQEEGFARRAGKVGRLRLHSSRRRPHRFDILRRGDVAGVRPIRAKLRHYLPKTQCVASACNALQIVNAWQSPGSDSVQRCNAKGAGVPRSRSASANRLLLQMLALTAAATPVCWIPGH